MLVADELVRVDFQNEIEYAATGGVYGDDAGAGEEFWCDSSGGDESFDMIDWRDDPAACAPDPAPDGVLSITWGPGRWKLQTGGVAPTYVRGVGLNFGQPIDAANCSRLENLPIPIGGEADSDPYGGARCGCESPCTALATFRVDGIFKRGVTRQDVSFPIRVETGAIAIIVDFVNPLYVCSEGQDGDVRYLQTDSCDGNGPSVAEAEVLERVSSSGFEEVLLGRWNIPLKIRLRKVASTDSGSDDGGGGGTCTLKPKGEFCVSDSECCSSNCGGKPGRRTGK
jgi:hypothetical protein